MFTGCPFRASIGRPSGSARGRRHCRGDLGLSGEYAPDSARVEGSSIV